MSVPTAKDKWPNLTLFHNNITQLTFMFKVNNKNIRTTCFYCLI